MQPETDYAKKHKYKHKTRDLTFKWPKRDRFKPSNHIGEE